MGCAHRPTLFFGPFPACCRGTCARLPEPSSRQSCSLLGLPCALLGPVPELDFQGCLHTGQDPASRRCNPDLQQGVREPAPGHPNPRPSGGMSQERCSELSLLRVFGNSPDPRVPLPQGTPGTVTGCSPLMLGQ